MVEETGPRASRNRLQTTTLLDAIEEYGFDAAFGGARRDEEKARAKERFFSFRDEFGQWDPKNQRPELWSLYNGRVRKGEHIRAFPISNWTELDVWQYIRREELEIPSIYFSHTREVFERDGMLLSTAPFMPLLPGEKVESARRALPHRRRHELHRRGRVDRGDARRHHRRGRQSPASPSAAPHAPMTASPKPPWKTARRRATSKPCPSLASLRSGQPIELRPTGRAGSPSRQRAY